MKEKTDWIVLFSLKICFLICIGILIIRSLNEISFRNTNSYLVSWKWLNSLFTDPRTEATGGLIAIGAMISGILYLLWLWWDPLMIRLPRQKGSPYLYYKWEEGLEPAPEWEYILELRAIVLDYPIYNPEIGSKIAIAAFRKLKKIAPQEAKNLLDYISENLETHLQNYPSHLLEDLKKI